METFRRELGQALRALRRSPGFAASAVAILALGIGANTAISAVVRAVLVRPLPYPAPERLVMIPARHRPEEMGEEMALANFLDIRRESGSYSEIGVVGPMSVDLTGAGRPERLQAAQVSPEALAALGVRPALGRLFSPGEDLPDSRIAILDHGLWRSRFGGDPGVVGKTIRLSGTAYVVVGVMPPSFRFPRRFAEDVRLLVPLRLTPERMQDRQGRWLYALGRLKEGVTVQQAQREIDERTASLARRFPTENGGWGARVVPLAEYLAAPVRPALLVLFATSLLFLLAACANIGNLLLARVASRRAETAVRVALGASPGALVRPAAFEGVILALAGGALGILVARGCLPLLIAAVPARMPRLAEIGVDLPVVLATVALSVLLGLGFGSLPALAARRSSIASDLARAGRGGSGAAGHLRARHLVTVAEVAAALVLLVGAGLLLSSLRRLTAVDPGFDPAGVTTLEVVLPANRYPDAAQRSAFFRQLVEAAAALRGVDAAGGVSHLPLSGSNSTEGYVVEDYPPADPHEIPEAAVRTVSRGYFRAMSIPMLAGRDFSASDRAESRPVLVVNRAFARRYWGVGGAVGRRLRFADAAGRGGPWEIVGVCGDVHHGGLDTSPVPEIYVSYEQRPADAMTLVARSKTSGAALAGALRAEVSRLDPELPVSAIRSMEEVLGGSVAAPSLYASLLSAFAGLALLLAVLGIGSVMAYSAFRRRAEMGIRLALGAQRRDLALLVVREAMGLAAAGIAVGVAVALVATRWIAALLFGIRPADPAVFAAAAVVLAAASLGASLAPAIRSAGVAPVEALRSP